MNNQLILVDKKDNIIGYLNKAACHKGKGKPHQAFSVFIFNSKSELLIQQRSKYKKLWPLVWSNTCCSHPRKGETRIKAAPYRIKEELGFSCLLKYILTFYYQAPYKNIGSENEVCAVFIGKCNKPIKANKKEVADYKFIAINDLKKDISKNPKKYTPWFKKELKLLEKGKWIKY